MKNFVVGLAIGVPTGMLLGDHRKAMAARLRSAFRRDLRGVTNTRGAHVAEDVNRMAEHSRETAGARHETSMQRNKPA